jgi:peroxiredoxin (alkyl hydroperoxide reductase subunit C)
MSIQVGQTAPDFTLKTNKMQDFALGEAKGKKNTVILFVPFAFTGG